VFGVERKEIPDDYNVSHYQFRLQGKKPVDIMMDNAQTSATEHALLLANEKVGESIPTIMGAVNHFENTATTKAEFMKILSQKYKNPRVLAEHVESSMAKSDAILPIKIRAKSIKLKPVKPISPPPPPAPVSTQVAPTTTNRSPEMIPITDETPTRAKSPLKSQKKLAKLDIDSIEPTQNRLSKLDIDSIDEKTIDSILADVDIDKFDINKFDINKSLNTGKTDPNNFYENLEKIHPNRAIEIINSLEVKPMKLILKSKKVSMAGMSVKQHYRNALFNDLGLDTKAKQDERPDLRKTPAKDVAIEEEKLKNPEFGSVPDKVGRIHKEMAKRKK
jgi:hypothetical protein